MWNFFENYRKTNINKKQSFYVGDAAGRIYKNKKDHSSDDRNFAHNIGIKFYTPEDFFDVNDDPHDILNIELKNTKNNYIDISSNKNLVIFVGR